MLKEAYDDVLRFRRDKEANSQKYELLVSNYVKHGNAMVPISPASGASTKPVPSSDLRVGDVVVLHSGQRVPADMLLLRTRDGTGSVFIKTDQLDGETDWKLRKAVPAFQNLVADQHIFDMEGEFNIEAPKQEIYDFNGQFNIAHGNLPEPLGLENTLWSNTVIATGSVLALVIFTGKETRSVMNASAPPTKTGATDEELNSLAKVLFCLTVLLSATLICLKGFGGPWYFYFFRFILLFSSIIPISLRVNLDLAKTLYSYFMMADVEIPGTIVRTSNIPEELGRLSYLFSDKTGTLTQNVMEFKKLQLRRPFLYDRDRMGDIISTVKYAYNSSAPESSSSVAARELLTSIRALALCHNVTPVFDEDTNERVYQASSPDEIALVRFTESVGVTLEARTESHMTLQAPGGELEEYDVLQVFPFTSESKRMGIIVRECSSGEIWFYVKGAESVLIAMVEANEWLEEECEALAREGLRTLVFGRRHLTATQYEEFELRYKQANAAMRNRQELMSNAIKSIEGDLELLCLSGVEDKLQFGVKDCLENLRNAGLRIWMLTGDKAETAKCIARSARLVDHTQTIFPVIVKNKRDAMARLDIFGSKIGAALLIDGTALQICLDDDDCRAQFVEFACDAPAVICCRCSPLQKAEVVKLIKAHSKKQCAAIGDGGNDVSMIQAADVGIGIVGKEGRQASLAADFSIDQFSYLQRLILWHGRNSYKRSARLSQFIMHRGTIITVIQAVFSSLFFYAAIPIYTGWLIVGYATIYTSLPVFSLVLDEDVSEEAVNNYPELYINLQKEKPLSYKTFFIWMEQSLFQGGVIMILGILLFEDQFVNVVSITFTALILTELMNVLFEVQKWHYLMVVSQVVSLLCYIVSVVVLKSYFEITYIISLDFLWRVSVVTACSCVPVLVFKYVQRKLSPSVRDRVEVSSQGCCF